MGAASRTTERSSVELVTILVYGALNPDLVHHVDRIPRAGDDVRSTSWRLVWGGKVANAGMALAGWGAEVAFTGLVLGADVLGTALVHMLDRPGVDLSYVETDSSQVTRHCVVLVTPDGDRTIVCTGYEGARWSRLPAPAWTGVEVVIVDRFSAGAGRVVAKEARRRGVPVVWIDPEPRDTRLATIAIWSLTERSRADAERSAAAVTVLTSGAGQIEVRSAAHSFIIAPPNVTAVDATGAGDVLAAGCAWGLLRGWTTERTVTWAAAAGAAMAASGRGEKLPTVSEIEMLLD